LIIFFINIDICFFSSLFFPTVSFSYSYFLHVFHSFHRFPLSILFFFLLPYILHSVANLSRPFYFLLVSTISVLSFLIPSLFLLFSVLLSLYLLPSSSSLLVPSHSFCCTGRDHRTGEGLILQTLCDVKTFSKMEARKVLCNLMGSVTRLTGRLF